jgi:hypothetical protein
MLMLRRTVVALGIVSLSSISAIAGDSEVRGNAALKYWQAFATLPALSDSESQKLRADALNMPLDAATRELIGKSEYSLKMLHHGAALPACDWGMEYEEGVETRLPQGPAAGVLCSLACLRARLRIEEGRPREAVDDLSAAMTLARHLSTDSGLVVLLFAYNLESRLNEAVAAALPRLDSHSLRLLQEHLNRLPPGGRPSQMLRFEERSLEWIIRKVRGAQDKEALVALLVMLVDGDAGGQGQSRVDKARGFLEECGGTQDGLVKRLEVLRATSAEIAPTLDLPLDQFAREWTREETKHAANPAFRLLCAPYPRIRQAQARAEVRRVLLTAAIDARIHGPDAVKNHLDPGRSGGTIEYVPANGGFLVRSKLVGADGKPLSLRVDGL